MDENVRDPQIAKGEPTNSVPSLGNRNLKTEFTYLQKAIFIVVLGSMTGSPASLSYLEDHYFEMIGSLSYL
jgi:hypothetical protein